MKKALTIVLAVVAITAAVVLGAIFLGGEKGIPLRIVYTSGAAGRLEPVTKGGGKLGGFARRATLLKQFVTPNTVLVDSGDFLLAYHDFNENYSGAVSRFAVKGLDDTGVEAVNVGFGDQHFGRKGIEDIRRGYRVPFISASVVDAETGEYVFEPFVVVEKSGVRIALVGVIDDDALTTAQMTRAYLLSKPHPKEVLQHILSVKDEGEGFGILSLQQALVRVKPLVEGKADVVVVVGMGGINIWNELLPYRDGKVFKIGLAMTMNAMDEPQMQGEIPVLLNSDLGTHIGVVDFLYRKDGSVKLTSWRAVPLGPNVPDDPELAGLPAEMRRSLGALDPMSLVDKRPPPDEAVYAGSEACAHCHRDIYAIWEKTAHARSLESLKSKDAQYDPVCLLCHVTDVVSLDGYVDEKTTPEMAAVSCESCHDRSSVHVREKSADPPVAGQKVYVPGPPICIRCHNKENSPDFRYPAYWAKIRHGKGRAPEPPAAGPDKSVE